jgi:GntR family transcriptional repressor for pyruvate dehydrogenase complex
MNTEMPSARRPRTLALELVEALGDRIRDGRLPPGDKLPTEAAIMEEFGVSRTVVREAISRLQAAGQVQTRHGIGTFVVGLGDEPGLSHRPEQLATLRDVVAVLELRIGIETEAAGLAAQRRTTGNLRRDAQRARRLRRGTCRPAGTRWPPISSSTAKSRVRRRTSTSPADGHPRPQIIPRARLEGQRRARRTEPARWPTCGASMPSTRASTTPSPRRTPMRRGPRCAPTWPTAASAAAAPSLPRTETHRSPLDPCRGGVGED